MLVLRCVRSDKTVILTLNFTKAGTASSASSPLRGEADRGGKKEKEANFQHKEKRKHLPLRLSSLD